MGAKDLKGQLKSMRRISTRKHIATVVVRSTIAPLILAAIIIIPIVSMNVLGDSTSGRSETVQLSVNPALRKVDPGRSTVFNIELINNGTSDDVFTLRSSVSPMNWTAMFPDDTVEIATLERKSTTLTIRPAEDALAKKTEITVSATSSIDGSVSTMNIEVEVNQRFSVDLSVSRVSKVSAGGSTDYEVGVNNLGNGPDTVSLNIIPTGEASSWAQSFTKSIQLDPGETQTHVQHVSVPSDTESGTYSFTVRARSTLGDALDSTVVLVQVKGEQGTGLGLGPWVWVLVSILVFVLIASSIVLIPAGKDKGGVEDKGRRAGRTASKKVKKIRRGAVPGGNQGGLARIEKRLDQLHEELLSIKMNHHKIMGHLQLHLLKDHGNAYETGAADETGAAYETGVPNETPSPDDRPDGVREGTMVSPSDSMEVQKGFEGVEPSPPNEGLPPEGPPESMSIGDEHGELRDNVREIGLANLVREGLCPRCHERVEGDWMRCANCGYLLASLKDAQDR